MSANKIFPYEYHTDDLPNGLRVITVPTGYPHIVALYIVVHAGSRNEVEPGRSGFAHLFEHLMFRGTKNFSSRQYDEMLKNIGADQNAYTTDDRTVYHTVFSREDFEQVMMLEADRFQNLSVPEDIFKTETKAVLGEYNKNSAEPVIKLFEILRDTAFDTHTYKHTTMGFLRDVENMPAMHDYSRVFFRRFYRPERATIIVAGDVERDKVMALVEKYWGGWQRGEHAQQIPVELEQTAERETYYEWPTPTLPWVAVAYKGPAYSDEQKDMPCMDLIASLGFSSNSELYQRLVIKEQKVDALFYSFEDHLDPFLLAVAARVKGPGDIDYVKEEIVKAFDSFRAVKVDEGKLNAVKSHVKYAFALGLDNSEAIAATLSAYVSLRRDPETINRLYALYDSITPDDLQNMANRYFAPPRRTAVTLSSKSG